MMKNDSSLSSYAKKVLANRWNQAENENISSGTLHVIKNGSVAVVMFLKKKVVSGGVIGIMSFTTVSACTAGSSTDPGENWQPPSATSTLDLPASEEATESPAPGSIDAGFSTPNIMLGERKPGAASERITLIAGNQQGLMEGAEVDPALKEKYSDKEIADAQQVAATVAIEYIADSNVLDSSDEESILKEHARLANSGYVTNSMQSTLKSEDQSLLDEDAESPLLTNLGNWRGIPNPDKPTKNGTYYDTFSMKLNETYLTADGDLAFAYEMRTTRSMINPDASDTKKYDEFQNIDFTIGLEFKGDNEPLVTGVHTTFKISTLVEGDKPEWTK